MINMIGFHVGRSATDANEFIFDYSRNSVSRYRKVRYPRWLEQDLKFLFFQYVHIKFDRLAWYFEVKYFSTLDVILRSLVNSKHFVLFVLLDVSFHTLICSLG